MRFAYWTTLEERKALLKDALINGEHARFNDLNVGPNGENRFTFVVDQVEDVFEPTPEQLASVEANPAGAIKRILTLNGMWKRFSKKE